MLSSFQIRNFRVFDALDIDHLAPVNLVVGGNNVGKTSLLEALRIYGEAGDEPALQQVLQGRGEQGLSPTLDDPILLARDRSGPTDDPVGHLFYGGSPLRGTAIELGPAASTRQSPRMRIRLAAFAVQNPSEGEHPIALSDADEDAVVRLVVEERTDGQPWSIVRRRRFGRLHSFRPHPPTRSRTIRWVGANPRDDRDLVAHWRTIGVRATLRSTVADALRLIDPKITEVAVLPASQHEGMEVVLIYDEAVRQPLRRLGRGISRLFQIIVAVVSGGDGLVLIDELDSGLHWSVQKSTWALLLRVARDTGVQLVVTTHSRDCVAGFRDALEECDDPGLGQLLHLGRSIRTSDHGAFVATSYDATALAQATRAGVEIR